MLAARGTVQAGRSSRVLVVPDPIQVARPGHPPGVTARGRPAGSSSTWTAPSPDHPSAVTTPFVLNPGALTCGANPGSPVTDDYASAVKFTGTIHSVTVDVSGEN